MGSVFPNRSINDVVNQLPSGLIDMTDILLNHTLFPYFYRIQPYNKKMEMLEDLKNGCATSPTNIRKTTDDLPPELKFCPICKCEDEKLYGESYWHTSHQIPLISVCHKHKCHLLIYKCKRKKQLNEDFILPDNYKGKIEADYNLKEYESVLTNILYDYLHLPLEVGPTPGYNNLAQALINSGYGKMRQRVNQSIDCEKLYTDLDEYYGSDIMERGFGKNPKGYIFLRISNWTLTMTERYALLAAFIKQPAQITFDVNPIEDLTKKKLLELKNKDVVYNKKYLAAELGIKPYQLDKIALKYNIEPFWVTKQMNKDVENKPLKATIKVYLTPEEKDHVLAYVEQHKYASASDFLKCCIKQVMTQ
jgi:hypothetical protein